MRLLDQKSLYMNISLEGIMVLTCKVMPMNVNMNILRSFAENRKWLYQNYTSLAKKYNNKFVAVKDKKVIAVEDTLEALFNTLKKKGIDAADVLIEFLTLEDILFLL